MTKKTNFAQTFRVSLSLCALLIALVGVYFAGRSIYSYSLPMQQGDYLTAAQNSEGSERALALYDAGLVLYRAKDFENSRVALTEAYSSLSAKHGQIGKSDLPLAGKIQFLLGLVSERTDQGQLAIDAYKDALRHDPTNLPAKYNLERLLTKQAQEGSGQGEGKDGKPGTNPSSGAGKSGNKGI